MLRVSTKVFLNSVLFALILLSCDSAKKTTEKKASDNGHLIGEVSNRDIETSEHNTWFTKGLVNYQVDTETLDDFENKPERLKKLSVKIFMGTWCEDSHRELPRFYNIMRYLNITDYQIYGMDYHKETPEKFEEGLNIKYVPTFIIYSEGKELNRIIESPIETLEKDLIAIVQAKNYTPNYQD